MANQDRFNFIAQVKFIPLNMGFWGFVDENGNKWRSSLMPESLKVEDIWVAVEAKLAAHEFSIFMWGKEIDIINFKIIEK